MTYFMKLHNLPNAAKSVHIRQFFTGCAIPNGGVQIIGGPNNEAYIWFVTKSDLLRGLELNGQKILGEPVTLLIDKNRDRGPKLSDFIQSPQPPPRLDYAESTKVHLHSKSHDFRGRSPSPQTVHGSHHVPPIHTIRDSFKSRQYDSKERSMSPTVAQRSPSVTPSSTLRHRSIERQIGHIASTVTDNSALESSLNLSPRHGERHVSKERSVALTEAHSNKYVPPLSTLRHSSLEPKTDNKKSAVADKGEVDSLISRHSVHSNQRTSLERSPSPSSAHISKYGARSSILGERPPTSTTIHHHPVSGAQGERGNSREKSPTSKERQSELYSILLKSIMKPTEDTQQPELSKVATSEASAISNLDYQQKNYTKRLTVPHRERPGSPANTFCDGRTPPYTSITNPIIHSEEPLKDVHHHGTPQRNMSASGCLDPVNAPLVTNPKAADLIPQHPLPDMYVPPLPVPADLASILPPAVASFKHHESPLPGSQGKRPLSPPKQSQTHYKSGESQLQPSYIAQHVYLRVRLEHKYHSGAASKLWSWVGGKDLACRGVVMVEEREINITRFACLAFDNAYHCMFAKQMLADKLVSFGTGFSSVPLILGSREMLMFFAEYDFNDFALHQSMADGTDLRIMPQERAILHEAHLAPKETMKLLYKKKDQNLPNQPPHSVLSLDLFDPEMINNTVYVQIVHPQVVYPIAASASDIWAELGGADGPCIGVIVVHDISGGLKVAMVAFDWRRHHLKEKSSSAVDHEIHALQQLQQVRQLGLLAQNHPLFVSTASGKDKQITEEEEFCLLKALQCDFRLNSLEGSNFEDVLLVAAKSHQNKKKDSRSQFDLGYIHCHSYLRIKLEHEYFSAAASEVWSWVGGPNGPCSGVLLMQGGWNKYAYLACGTQGNRSLVSKMLCETHSDISMFSSYGMLISLLDIEFSPQKWTMYQSSEYGCDCEITDVEGIALKNCTRAKPTSVHLYNLRADITACEIWSSFTSEGPPCTGVILVRNSIGIAWFAYATIFGSYNITERATECGFMVKDWSPLSRSMLAKIDATDQIFRSTDSGKDRMLMPAEKAQIVKNLDLYLEYLIAKDTNVSIQAMHNVTEDASSNRDQNKEHKEREESEELMTSQEMSKDQYIYFHNLRSDITANEIQSSFECGEVPRTGVTLVREANGNALFAFAGPLIYPMKRSIWHGLMVKGYTQQLWPAEARISKLQLSFLNESHQVVESTESDIDADNTEKSRKQNMDNQKQELSTTKENNDSNPPDIKENKEHDSKEWKEHKHSVSMERKEYGHQLKVKDQAEYIYLKNIKSDITASKIQSAFKTGEVPNPGVTLVQKTNGNALFAFVGPLLCPMSHRMKQETKQEFKEYTLWSEEERLLKLKVSFRTSSHQVVESTCTEPNQQLRKDKLVRHESELSYRRERKRKERSPSSEQRRHKKWSASREEKGTERGRDRGRTRRREECNTSQEGRRRKRKRSDSRESRSTSSRESRSNREQSDEKGKSKGHEQRRLMECSDSRERKGSSQSASTASRKPLGQSPNGDEKDKISVTEVDKSSRSNTSSEEVVKGGGSQDQVKASMAATHYLRLVNLRTETTASQIKTSFTSIGVTSTEVTLVSTRNGDAVLAYVGIVGPPDDQAGALLSVKDSYSNCSPAEREMELRQVHPSFQIVQSSDSGIDKPFWRELNTIAVKYEATCHGAKNVQPDIAMTSAEMHKLQSKTDLHKATELGRKNMFSVFKSPKSDSHSDGIGSTTKKPSYVLNAEGKFVLETDPIVPRLQIKTALDKITLPSIENKPKLDISLQDIPLPSKHTPVVVNSTEVALGAIPLPRSSGIPLVEIPLPASTTPLKSIIPPSKKGTWIEIPIATDKSLSKDLSPADNIYDPFDQHSDEETIPVKSSKIPRGPDKISILDSDADSYSSLDDCEFDWRRGLQTRGSSSSNISSSSSSSDDDDKIKWQKIEKSQSGLAIIKSMDESEFESRKNKTSIYKDKVKDIGRKVISDGSKLSLDKQKEYMMSLVQSSSHQSKSRGHCQGSTKETDEHSKYFKRDDRMQSKWVDKKEEYISNKDKYLLGKPQAKATDYPQSSGDMDHKSKYVLKEEGMRNKCDQENISKRKRYDERKDKNPQSSKPSWTAEKRLRSIKESGPGNKYSGKKVHEVETCSQFDPHFINTHIYLRFPLLSDYSVATPGELWSVVGGPSGQCSGVIVVHSKSKDDLAAFTCFAFKKTENRLAAQKIFTDLNFKVTLFSSQGMLFSLAKNSYDNWAMLQSTINGPSQAITPAERQVLKERYLAPPQRHVLIGKRIGLKLNKKATADQTIGYQTKVNEVNVTGKNTGRSSNENVEKKDVGVEKGQPESVRFENAEQSTGMDENKGMKQKCMTEGSAEVTRQSIPLPHSVYTATKPDGVQMTTELMKGAKATTLDFSILCPVYTKNTKADQMGQNTTSKGFEEAMLLNIPLPSPVKTTKVGEIEKNADSQRLGKDNTGAERRRQDIIQYIPLPISDTVMSRGAKVIKPDVKKENAVIRLAEDTLEHIPLPSMGTTMTKIKSKVMETKTSPEKHILNIPLPSSLNSVLDIPLPHLTNTLLHKTDEHEGKSTVTEKKMEPSQGEGKNCDATKTAKSERNPTETDKKGNAIKADQWISNQKSEAQIEFLRVVMLSQCITACVIWKWFKSAGVPSPGVTLVKDAAGKPLFLFVGIVGSAAKHISKLALAKGSYTICSAASKDQELDQLALSYQILEATESGIDRVIMRQVKTVSKILDDKINTNKKAPILLQQGFSPRNIPLPCMDGKKDLDVKGVFPDDIPHIPSEDALPQGEVNASTTNQYNMEAKLVLPEEKVTNIQRSFASKEITVTNTNKGMVTSEDTFQESNVNVSPSENALLKTDKKIVHVENTVQNIKIETVQLEKLHTRVDQSTAQSDSELHKIEEKASTDTELKMDRKRLPSEFGLNIEVKDTSSMTADTLPKLQEKMSPLSVIVETEMSGDSQSRTLQRAEVQTLTVPKTEVNNLAQEDQLHSIEITKVLSEDRFTSTEMRTGSECEISSEAVRPIDDDTLPSNKMQSFHTEDELHNKHVGVKTIIAEDSIHQKIKKSGAGVEAMTVLAGQLAEDSIPQKVKKSGDRVEAMTVLAGQLLNVEKKTIEATVTGESSVTPVATTGFAVVHMTPQPNITNAIVETTMPEKTPGSTIVGESKFSAVIGGIGRYSVPEGAAMTTLTDEKVAATVRGIGTTVSKETIETTLTEGMMTSVTGETNSVVEATSLTVMHRALDTTLTKGTVEITMAAKTEQLTDMESVNIKVNKQNNVSEIRLETPRIEEHQEDTATKCRTKATEIVEIATKEMSAEMSGIQASASNRKPTADIEYLRVTKLSPSITACAIWEWFISAGVPSPGVTLVKDLVGKALFLFVGIAGSAAEHISKLALAKGSYTVCSKESRDNELDTLDPSYQVLEANKSGADRIVSRDMKHTIKDVASKDEKDTTVRITCQRIITEAETENLQTIKTNTASTDVQGVIAHDSGLCAKKPKVQVTEELSACTGHVTCNSEYKAELIEEKIRSDQVLTSSVSITVQNIGVSNEAKSNLVPCTDSQMSVIVRAQVPSTMSDLVCSTTKLEASKNNVHTGDVEMPPVEDEVQSTLEEGAPLITALTEDKLADAVTQVVSTPQPQTMTTDDSLYIAKPKAGAAEDKDVLAETDKVEAFGRRRSSRIRSKQSS